MSIQLERLIDSESILLLSFNTNKFDVNLAGKREMLQKLYDIDFKESAPAKGVVLDLEGIDFMDESGSGFFIIILKFFLEKNMIVTAFGLSNNLRTMFEVIRFDRVLQVHKELKDAVEMLNLLPYPKNYTEARYLSFPEKSRKLLKDRAAGSKEKTKDA